MESDYDYLFKIVLIGDAGVGKTSIVRRYCDGVFTSAGIPTIGVDFCIKTIKIGGDSIKVVKCISFLVSLQVESITMVATNILECGLCVKYLLPPMHCSLFIAHSLHFKHSGCILLVCNVLRIRFNRFFSFSYKYGILQGRKDFVQLHKVIIGVQMQ